MEDIMNAYTESWKLGLKAVAIYRDNSKRVQPLSSGRAARARRRRGGHGRGRRGAGRRRWSTARSGASCPTSAASITHKFSIGGHEGYITVGMYDDGAPGEIFITMAKEGSTISGLMDAFATAVSFNLQYGVPLKFLVDKFAHVRFEPSESASGGCGSVANVRIFGRAYIDDPRVGETRRAIRCRSLVGEREQSPRAGAAAAYARHRRTAVRTADARAGAAPTGSLRS